MTDFIDEIKAKAAEPFDYRSYVMGWIANETNNEDGHARWKSERKLRNYLNIPAEVREECEVALNAKLGAEHKCKPLNADPGDLAELRIVGPHGDPDDDWVKLADLPFGNQLWCRLPFYVR